MRLSRSTPVCARRKVALNAASPRLFLCIPSISIQRCRIFAAVLCDLLDEFLTALESKHADLLYLHDEDLHELVNKGSYQDARRANAQVNVTQKKFTRGPK